MSHMDVINHSTFSRLEKWDQDKVEWVSRKSGILTPKRNTLARWTVPDEIIEDSTSNLTTTNGLGRITNLLIGSGSVAFSNANTTCLGVGSSVTAATAADTDLNTPLYYQEADSSPTRVTTNVSNDTIQVVATFASANGNGAWNEWGLILVTTATSATTLAGTGTSPIFFNHHTGTAYGTKASGASWAFTVKLTWS